MRAAVLVVATGCWHASPAPAPAPSAPAPPQLAGFAEADLIVVDPFDYTLTTVSLAHDVPRVLATTRLGPRLPDQPTTMPEKLDYPPQRLFVGGWADRNKFYARTGPRQVIAISAAGIATVGLPPRAPGESEPHLFAPWSEVDLVVDEDGAWWSRCVEEGPEDGGRCATWSSTMLWPRTDHADTEKLPGELPLPAVEAPAGYRVEGTECVSPDGARHALVTRRGPEDRRGIAVALWISQVPPRLLVTFDTVGEFRTSPDNFELRDGCGPVILEGDDPPVGGPDGLWATRDTVYRGAKKLGTIPPGAVHFRPR